MYKYSPRRIIGNPCSQAVEGTKGLQAPRSPGQTRARATGAKHMSTCDSKVSLSVLVCSCLCDPNIGSLYLENNRPTNGVCNLRRTHSISQSLLKPLLLPVPSAFFKQHLFLRLLPSSLLYKTTTCLLRTGLQWTLILNSKVTIPP